MSQAIRGAAAEPSAVAGCKGFKAELDGPRERMRGLGSAMTRSPPKCRAGTPVRPGQAYQLAFGRTLDQAAARYNDLAAREGTGPQGRSSMTGSHLCEYGLPAG